MLLHRKNDRRDANSNVVDWIGGPRRNARRIAFDVEQKLRIHQDRAERHFDAGFEVAFGAPCAIELHRRFQILFVDRPPIRPAHEIGKNLSWHTPLHRSDSWAWQMKSRRRLGVSPGPPASYGPMIET